MTWVTSVYSLAALLNGFKTRLGDNLPKNSKEQHRPRHTVLPYDCIFPIKISAVKRKHV